MAPELLAKFVTSKGVCKVNMSIFLSEVKVCIPSLQLFTLSQTS